MACVMSLPLKPDAKFREVEHMSLASTYATGVFPWPVLCIPASVVRSLRLFFKHNKTLISNVEMAEGFTLRYRFRVSAWPWPFRV